MQISVPQRILFTDFENLLKEVISLDLKKIKSISFDFSNTNFLSSFSMVLFVLLCEFLVDDCKLKVHLKLSKDSDKSRLNSSMFILARVGFFDALPKDITCYPYKPKRKKEYKGTNDSILEITRINKTEAMKIINLVESAIKINTEYQTDQVNDICQMVSEIIQNILLHSDCKRHGLIAIQSYPQLHIVQLVIADSGLGIPTTLRRTTEYRNIGISDSDAISESLKAGVSQFGKDEDRGEGLTKCSTLAKKHLAKMFIRSNTGSYSLDFKSKKFIKKVSSNLSGTQIYVNFPAI